MEIKKIAKLLYSKNEADAMIAREFLLENYSKAMWREIKPFDFPGLDLYYLSGDLGRELMIEAGLQDVKFWNFVFLSKEFYEQLKQKVEQL